MLYVSCYFHVNLSGRVAWYVLSTQLQLISSASLQIEMITMYKLVEFCRLI